MSTQGGAADRDDLALCRVCGQPIPTGEGRYRGPDGEVHVRCFDGPRILVVDDDPVLRDLIVNLVHRGRRCQVHAVSNGHEALERVRSATYDLILCDLRMPEMDGLTFYEAMRADRPELASRIVFMTAHQRTPEYGAFLREVRAPVLGKPFSRADLDDTLARMIGPRAPS